MSNSKFRIQRIRLIHFEWPYTNFPEEICLLATIGVCLPLKGKAALSPVSE